MCGPSSGYAIAIVFFSVSMPISHQRGQGRALNSLLGLQWCHFAGLGRQLQRASSPGRGDRGILFLGLLVKSAVVGAEDNNTSQWSGEVGGQL